MMAETKYSYQSLLQSLTEGGGLTSTDRVEKTLRLSFEGHRGQFRETRTPNSRIPFIVHPVGTAILVCKYFTLVQRYLESDLESAVCVALSHDLLEDSQINAELLEKTAGSSVRSIVESLTKPPAGVAGKEKDARNTEFAQQIIRGGPTAVFVKICDSMHNMSRPNITPTKLFRKTVDKARTWYQPMLDFCPLGHEFAQIYRDALTRGEADATEEERFTKEKPTPQSLEAAVGEYIAASAGKVLELHDITAILSRVCATLNTSVWRISGKHSNNLSLVSTSEADAFSDTSFEMSMRDTSEILKGQASRILPLRAKPNKDIVVFMIPIQVGPNKSFAVALAFASTFVPEWLTLNSATIAVQFLAHRLVVSEVDRKSRVMSEAARLGMQLDAELASETGITPTDLARLQQWRTRCQQATSIVEALLRIHFLSDVSRLKVNKAIRIESRTKTVNSILRKLVERLKVSPSRFEEMEDIAGVRVICPTLECIEELRHFLVSPTVDNAGCRLHPGVDKPIRDWLNEATIDGYRALHLLLEVRTSLDESGTRSVICEVQLRTAFQDIWATIAHKTAYGRSIDDRNLKDSLQELSQRLHQCEVIAEKISQCADSRLLRE